MEEQNQIDLSNLSPEFVEGVLSPSLLQQNTERELGQEVLDEEKKKKEDAEREASDANFFTEAGAAIVGGAADAVESVGQFGELVGDTFKTGLNSVFGRPLDQTQNPFSKEYVEGDASWLDLPDEWVPENKTGLGKFARGLLEFGFLSVATGGIAGAAGSALKVGTKARAALVAAGVGEKGLRKVKFIQKGAKIAGEGAAAELISSGSEEANIANLASEYTPWLLPWVTEALSVEEEDNPWVARIKTITAGAGLNIVGHTIGGFVKGRFEARKALKEGKTPDEANKIGNEAMQKEIAKDQEALLQENADRQKANMKEGKGIDPDPNAPADPGRTSDNFVNGGDYDATEKTVIPADPDGLPKAVTEAVNDMKSGGNGDSHVILLTKAYIDKVARGDANLAQFVEEQMDRIIKKDYQIPANMKYNAAEIKQLMVKKAEELTQAIDNGDDIVKNFKEALDSPGDYRVYADNITAKSGAKPIKTISPLQKGALQLVISGVWKQLGDQSATIAQVGKDLPMHQPIDDYLDVLEVGITEIKKLSLMWSNDGRIQQIKAGAQDVITEADINKIKTETKEYIDKLREMNRNGDQEALRMIAEVNAIADANITSSLQVHEFFKAKLFGGEFDGKKIQGKLKQQSQATLYNSLLSSIRTPVKAISSTNMLALMRPFQQYIGAMRPFQGFKVDEKAMAVAAVQIDGMYRSLAESFQMFAYNWKRGFQGKSLVYEGRYDLEQDMAEWRKLGQLIDQYGSKNEKRSYEFLNAVTTFNNWPWVRASQIAMGSGDSAARTFLGRQAMLTEAAHEALEKGTDLKDLKKVVRETEDNFRNKLFKKNEDNMYVVSDAGATMAGDEVAMTSRLQGNLEGFEKIGELPFMKAFFPFVRTGFNSLQLTFAHTPLTNFTQKYKDIRAGKNLMKYGIKNDTQLAQERALIEGRVASGYMIATLAAGAALTGKLTGSYPYRDEDKDAWIAAKIKPNSFVMGDPLGTEGGKRYYVSYENMEPFNTIFQFVGDVVQNADILGEEKTENLMQKISFMIASVLVDKSMLSGVEDLARLMNPTTSESLLKRSGARYLRSHIPFAGLAGQLGEVTDGIQREYQTFWETLGRRDPIARHLMHPKYDVTSKDRSGKAYSWSTKAPLLRLFNSSSPIPIFSVEGDTVKETLVAIRFNQPETMSRYKGEPLNSYQMSEMQRIMSMGDLRARLEKLFATRSWQNEFKAYRDGEGDMKRSATKGFKLTDQKFYTDVINIFEDEKEIAVRVLQKENPELYETIIELEHRKQISKSGDINKQVQKLIDGSFPR